MKKTSALILIYDDVQSFPPTLNQCLYLSQQGIEVRIISRNVKDIPWNFPKNVHVTRVNSLQGGGTITSLRNFIRFQLEVFRAMFKHKPERYYVYDLYSCLAVLLPSKFLSSKRHKLWYHSHDVINPVKGYNLSNLAKWAEKKVIQQCYGFSSPSVDRLTHYPAHQQAVSKYIEIRNYPSLEIFRFGKPKSVEGNTIKLVFSGAISVNRGISELAEALQQPVGGKQLELHLFTYPSTFTTDLKDKIERLKISDRVYFHDPLSYKQLAETLPQFDIGIAFYNGTGILDTSSATGSNKLYEYGASGLPVLFLDKINFREVLSDLKPWVEFVQLNPTSIQNGIEQVIHNYTERSTWALEDINSKCNSAKSLNDVAFYNFNSKEK